MDREFSHVPVMLDKVIAGLDIRPQGVYADGTAGGGGHAFEIGRRLSESGRLIASDRDAEAIEACRRRLAELKCQTSFLQISFENLPQYLKDNDIMIDGLLLDLGVSSFQLDTADRGFSYMLDAELDMRMDRDSTLSAKDVVNTYSQYDLERIFKEYGEERYAKSIAAGIVRARQDKPVTTTFQLVDIIKSSVPPRALREKQHPAKRVFQAIRIEVNDELGQLQNILESIMSRVNEGGRVAVITFHSLEDRIVKTAFAKFERPCTCPPDFPVCICGKKPLGHALELQKPSSAEVAANPRARSAKLRVFVKHTEE